MKGAPPTEPYGLRRGVLADGFPTAGFAKSEGGGFRGFKPKEQLRAALKHEGRPSGKGSSAQAGIVATQQTGRLLGKG